MNLPGLMKKKYRISPFYIGVYAIGSVFILANLAIGIYALTQWPGWWLSWVMFLLPLLGMLLIAYQLFLDFQAGTFSVDQRGVTMNIAFRKWFHAWADICSCDVVGVSVGDGETFWVYFADRILSDQEKRDFLRKTRRDLKHIAFFQYNDKILLEIMPLLPPVFADKLRERAQQVETRMTKVEKLYHK